MTYTLEEVKKEALDYFSGDELATNVWMDKYCLKNTKGEYVENSPLMMYKRLAEEFSRIEEKYPNPINYNEIRELLEDQVILPGGSLLYGIGNNYSISSLGNCFVIGNEADSYGGICTTDQEQVQLMKRRAGVGHDLSHLRAENTSVSNSAGSSTGATSFMDRFSHSTREVSQNGRRGALMLSMNINHPDIEKFITAKDDTTKITGANISVKVDDEFIKEVTNPISSIRGDNYFLWKRLIHQAWKSAEPGVLFWDTILKEDIPSSYGKEWTPTSTNPCFHPDTLIETVNGRVKISDIKNPTKVYSMDKEGKLCIKNASASFVSKRNAQTIKITLRNGSSIQVTPDHKMYTHNKGWVEAGKLKLGDRIVHLSRNRRGKRYSGVKLTSQHFRDYIMEHKLVYESYNGVIKEGFDIHHIDGNTFNNNYNNLELLEHGKHSRHTALNDNPQNHQIRDVNGRFISPDKRYDPKIENTPDILKTNLKNRGYNVITSIIEGENIDVYDIQVEDTHCLVANNMVAHNCGEIPLCPYDSCRLLSVNLTKFVDNPFTPQAKFNFERFKHVVYIAQKLMDDVVDLEEEKINLILNKIDKDPEDEEIKRIERNLWLKIKEKLLQGRRTGLSGIGLADTLAMLNILYSSNSGITIAEEIYKQLAITAYKSSIDMAKDRGAFPIYDCSREANNPFISRIYEHVEWKSCGRRNIALLTIPPTGTQALIAHISSGMEPVYMLEHKRRRKVDPNHPNVSFVDKNGDCWEEYVVLHPKFQEWLALYTEVHNKTVDDWTIEEIKGWQKLSPWHGSTAYELNPLDRVKMQGAIQKWVDHSISSTINLPKEATEEDVANIYMEAWKQGCKGITIYRDGSRDGVLVSNDTIKSTSFKTNNAPKRPKVLPGEVFTPTIKGIDYLVVVGLLESKPYEVFACKNTWNIKGNYHCDIIKKTRGRYDVDIKDKLLIEDITSDMSQIEEDKTRLISVSLRHGANIKFLVEQLNKAKGNGFQDFSKVIARVLKKYIKDEEIVTGATCSNCGSTDLIYKEGCEECNSCGVQKCG